MAASMQKGYLASQHNAADTEEDYGLIRPSLIKQLRSILDQYPDDGQILKELIQNAEDAGATEVKFLYDENQYPTRSLHHPDMAQFQGSALYAYNNARFAEKDWTGIRMLQDSIKEKDPMKVGRFGLGFKSVLHMTDLPSVLSSDRLFMIDPHEKYFQYKGDKTSGYSWNLQQKKSAMEAIPDQFEPFKSILQDASEAFNEGYYNGTLFRFPLRVQKSRLSETLYGAERVNNLFDSFQVDSQNLMVFLKNIESIKLYKRQRGQQQPKLLYEVRLTADCLDYVKQKRREFIEQCKTVSANGQGVTLTYLVKVETAKYLDTGQVDTQVFRWLVNEFRAGRVSAQLKQLQNDPALSLVPLVGVAMPIQKRTESSSTQTAPNKSGDMKEEPPDGQVFCFLPLPVEQKTSTGLPVHVNGYFAISQNRRHLKWPTAGHNIKADKCVHWNQCLIRELLPLSYTHLLLKAIQISKKNSSLISPADVYHAIPDIIAVDEKWQVFLEPLFEMLFSQPIIFTLCANGSWVPVRDVIFDCLKEEEETNKLITKVCIESDVNLAKVPMHILHAMGAFSQHSVEVVSPSGIRAVLRQNPACYNRLQRPAKLLLLLYILKDEDFQDLIGIQLLPCADGTFATFQRQKDSVFIPTHDTPRHLFPTLENILLAEDLQDILMHKLAKVATEGVCQLRFLDKKSAAALIPKVIPKAWLNKDHVTIDGSTAVSALWFEHLWNYLRKEYPRDLTPFSGLPVLPLNSSVPLNVVPLSFSSPCLMKSAMGVELKDNLIKFMSMFNIQVVEDLPQYVQSHAAVLGNFVKLPFKEDIIEIVFQSYKSHPDKEILMKQVVSETSDEEKLTFVKEIAELEDQTLSQPYISFLRKMPIFPSTSTVHGKPSFVSIEKVSTAVALSDLPCAMSDKLVNISDDRVHKAALMLGAIPLEKEEAVKEYIFRDIRRGLFDKTMVANIMEFVFKNFSQFTHDEDFVRELADVPFVPVGTEQLRKPNELCDPEDELLSIMYGDQKEEFPEDGYADTQMLVYLRRLGIKTWKTIPAKDLLRFMFSLEDEKDQAGTLKKSKSCLNLVNMRSSLLWEETQGKLFLEWVTDISWVPVIQEKPESFPSSLPWCSGSFTKKPCEVRTANFASLVGSVKSTLDSKYCNNIIDAFGWQERPPVQEVMKQLKEIVQCYDPSEKAKFLTLVSTTYKYLMLLDTVDVQEALETEKLTTWIWQGDGFVSSNCVVTGRLPVDTAPYLFSLPSEMSRFTSMFRAHGVKDTCEPEMLIRVLNEVSQRQDIPKQEQDRNLQMTIDILNFLSDKCIEDDVAQSIPIPTQSDVGLKMIPLRLCTYCDVEWIRQGFDLMEFDEQDGITFIHPNMPVSTAAKLGVPTLMSRMLHAEELAITGFGQGEPLTSRLHQLLEDYSDGLAIFKEMIQNADDAGATEICFLYDERANEDCMKYLIDDGMRECQGPALWVYNNSVFTNQDFVNITKLGGATKEQEPEKIGRFGLGFNAVYNITDVPSFVSQNNIVIFDPHTTHLGKGIKDRSRPGIKIDMTKNKTLLRKLSDQFQPYQNIFNCDVAPDKQGYYNGTLFRLPLRTKLQAARSEISGLHYDKKEMLTLIDMLVKHAHNLLLFTQNLQTLKVTHISPGGSPATAKEVFALKKEVIEVIRENSAAKTPSESGSKTSPMAFLNASAEYIKKSSKPMSGRMMSVPQVPQSTVLICTSSRVPNSDMFSSPEKSTKDIHWLVSGCVGQEYSKKLSIASKGTLVPVGGVAVKLNQFDDGFVPEHIEKEAGKSSAFCFLPLPVQTGLPVHINGTFALESSRRHLSQKTDDDKDDKKAEWNEALLEDAVTHAYTQALCDLKKILPSSGEVQFYEVWPTFKTADAYFQPLVTAFYSNLSSLAQTPLLCHKGTVITIENAVFFQMEKTITQQKFEMITQVFESCGGGCHVLTAPTEVIKCFDTAGHQNLLAEKHYDLYRFYDEIFLPNIDRIQKEIRDPLLVLALQQNYPDVNKLLANSSCIPATPNGKELKKIKDLVHPTGLAARLYSPEDGCFPYGEIFNDGNVLAHLQKLGMKLNDVSWNDIIERAKSIQTLEQEDLMNTRYQVLMAFVDRKLIQCSSYMTRGNQRVEVIPDTQELHDIRQILQKVPFLPVAQKPDHYPVAWSGEKAKSTDRFCVSDVYSWDTRYLVSATQIIADGRKMTPRTKEFLQFGGNEVTIQQVTTQLEHVLAVDVEIHNTCNAYDQLQKALTVIYNYLQMKLKTGDVMVEQLCDILHERPCLLVANKFCSPSSLAMHLRYDCAPYLHALPDDTMKRFQPLMTRLKVKNTFDVKDFVTALQQIHKESEGQKLSDRQVDVAVSLTTLLNNSMETRKLTVDEVVEQFGEIYIPNARNSLEPSRTLCYNDCPWIPATQEMNFTHSNITFKSSKRLGVKTKRQEALSMHAKGIPFGQKERLTNTLKRVLSTYPCDHEILKELIQNADDAQATEIHFIRDSRHHPTEHVFENSWKDLQGPALCVYNNRPFTVEDMEGIQRLGEGSKSMDPSKTGQYGIGFSSVYHLTDAPSVLTESHDVGRALCVFDPHCYFVPGATPAEPGMRYDNVEQLQEAFPDVFSCYLPGVFNMKESTMMRFPLRTTEMAEHSKISKQHITMSRLRNMLDELKLEAFDILLFTNYLEEIKISDIDPVTGTLVNTYTVKIILSEKQKHQRMKFAQDMKEFGRQIQADPQAVSSLEHKDYENITFIADNMGRQEKWCITQSAGFQKDLDIPECIKDAFQDGDLMLMPRGGVACLLEERLNGRPESSNKQMKAFCFLPLPLQLDLPVHVNAHFALGHENRRHLWFKDKKNDVKTTWNNLLCSSVIADAYISLMKAIRLHGLATQVVADSADVVCSRHILDSAISTYMSCFPPFSDTQPEWNLLVRSVYTKIARENAQVLPAIQAIQLPEEEDDGGSPKWHVEWFPPAGEGDQKAFFSKQEEENTKQPQQRSFLSRFKRMFKVTSEKQTVPDEQVLKEVLLKCGMKLLEAPPMVVDSFVQCGIEIDFMSPEGVILFFRSYSSDNAMCDLGQLPCRLSETPFLNERILRIVLAYCKKDEDFVYKLGGLPLLMTDDSVLRVFDEDSPVFFSLYSDLVRERSDLFIKKTLMTSVFDAIDISACPVFKKLSIESLAEILHYKLPAEQFCSEEGKPVEWKKGFNAVPDTMWMKQFWTFVKKEVTGDTENEDRSDDMNCQESLLPLSDWCLLPARLPGNNLLFPIGSAEKVVHLSRTEAKWYGVTKAVQKMDIPEIDTLAVNTDTSFNTDVIKSLVTTFDKPQAVLEILHENLSSKMTETFSKEDANNILGYFVHHTQQLKDMDRSTEWLRDLPFYTTIYGDMIPLTNCVVYTLPAKIPTQGIEIWQSQSGTVFLERNPEFSALYDMIGCASISVLDVYCKFIFQHLEYFPDQDRMIHLHHVFNKYIKDGASHEHELSDEEKQNLLETLKDLPFIPDGSGELQPASEFYDPENVVFQVMLTEDKFPPPPKGNLFRESEWYSFLGELGLVREMNEDMFVGFANQIASEGFVQDKNAAWAKSKVLVQHLFSMTSASRDAIMPRITDINFVMQDKVSPKLTKLLPQYGDVGDETMHFIAFRDSISKQYEKLVWTQCGILPEWADPSNIHHLRPDEQNRILDGLEIQREPRVDVVVNHLLELSRSIVPSDPRNLDGLEKIRTHIFKELYRFLSDHTQDEDMIEKLSKESVVVVDEGHRMVKPCQTVISFHGKDEIRPYLFRLPVSFGEFADFFKRLGAKERVSVEQYARVLECIKTYKGVDILSPNETAKVLKAMKGVIEALETSSTRESSISMLYLPTETCRLVDAHKLVFNDTPSFYDRVRDFGMQFVVNPRECGIKSRHAEEMLMLLPQHVRPVMLSSLVKEELMEKCRVSMGKEGLAKQLDQRVRSERFLSAVARLVRHDAQKTGQKVDDGHMYDVLDRLSTIHVFGVNRVVTHLTFKGKHIDGSEVEKGCFVEKIQGANRDINTWNLYIQQGTTLGQDLLVPLAEIINNILSGMLRDSVLYLLPILSCPEDKITTKLDSLNIRLDVAQPTSRLSILPVLGTEIDEARLPTLKQGETEYSAGEYVGFKGLGDERVVHARVREEVMSPEDNRVYLLETMDGQDAVIAESTQLYKYRSDI